MSEFIKPTDEAIAVARPSAIEKFYIESEHEEAEAEQIANYGEKGENEAREADTKAAALEHEADKADAFSCAAEQDADDARQDELAARRVLGGLVRRPTDWKFMKYTRLLLILLGDIAGVAGAALLLGEEPFNAFMQAISAAVTAVTLGAVGREVRYIVSARWRQKPVDELSDEEQPYAAFFVGSHNGEHLIRLIVLTCAVGIILIGVGIYALRDATEGAAAGIVFGCLALALGLASFYNSFDTSDDVAEMLDNKALVTRKAEEKARLAREAAVIKERAAARREAASIRKANELAGEATAAGVRRHLAQVLGNSPGVAGNGTAREPIDVALRRPRTRP